MTKKLLLSVILCATLITINLSAQEYPYKNASLSPYERAKDLVSRMTLAEKIQQMGHKTPEISRLGVSGYNYWSEALHGVARSGLATSFPDSRAMSSTWDPQLVFDCASATADEARIYNNTKSKGLIYWCPTINMSRDPRWGRDEENYGEDVLLTSRLAVQYIKGMQGNDAKYAKTIATAKHFACNNYEKGRHSTSSNVTARDLREYYLPCFESCVKEGRVQSIMSAYNAINGIPCGASHELLIDILRHEWGFNGFVVSDCGAVDDIYQGHKYVTTGEEASAVALKNGMDLNCGSTFQEYFQKAVESSLVTEADLDTALIRVFRARFSVGEFDNATIVPYRSISSDLLDCQAHRDLALKAAKEAIVLLKNANDFLPLNKDIIKKIAIIGPSASGVQLGGYTGSPSVQVSALQGIADKLGVNISNGKTEAESFSEKSGRIAIESGGTGSDIGYIQNNTYVKYDSINFGIGKTKLDINVATKNGGDKLTIVIDDKDNGTELATITIPQTSSSNWYTFQTLSFDIPQTSGIHKVWFKFTGTDKYLFNIDWFRFYAPTDVDPTSGNGPIMYAQGCQMTATATQAELDSAANMAKKADVVVLCLGTDLTVSDEGNDRKSLNLPGSQEQLLEAVYAANKNVILVLESNSSLTINWAKDNVPSILEMWYNGQAQGTALADVLFGDYNPQGKLTTTWYNAMSDLPAITDYNIHNGRTYMYYKKTPLFPFGHGLSYTSYTYSNLNISKNTLAINDSVTIRTDITNAGKTAGTEVVQFYAHCHSSLDRPVKQLIGFDRVTLAPGETKTVSVTLKHAQLSYFNEARNTYDVEAGDVDIYAGSSSADIRLAGKITTEAATVKTTYHQQTTSITHPHADISNTSGKIYDISGRVAADDTGRLTKGIYVISGKTVIKRTE